MARRSNPSEVQVAIQQFLERVDEVNALHPETDEKLLFYRSYTIASAYCPEKFVVCHCCMKQSPKAPPKYLKCFEMASHFRIYHRHADFECEYKTCKVKFASAEEKDAHHHYIHEKNYGWWIPTH